MSYEMRKTRGLKANSMFVGDGVYLRSLKRYLNEHAPRVDFEIT
jgi:hypothetical protein